MEKNQKKFTYFLYRFFTLKDSAHHIAAGAAVGLFLGILPIEGIILSLIITTIFRFNRAAAMISLAAMNVWAMILALPFAATIGSVIFGVNSTDLANQFYLTYQNGWGYFFTDKALNILTFPLLTGYIVIAGAFSIALYFILYSILKTNMKQQAESLK